VRLGGTSPPQAMRAMRRRKRWWLEEFRPGVKGDGDNDLDGTSRRDNMDARRELKRGRCAETGTGRAKIEGGCDGQARLRVCRRIHRRAA
jgi:hypothetical protein